MTRDQKLFTGYCILAAIVLLSIYPAKLAMVQGFESTVFDLLLGGGDTVYARDFSDKGFQKIRRGMSFAEVMAILGPPLDTYPVRNDVCCDTGMRWTRSAHDSDYRVRVILFKKGIVAEKFAEFYLD